MSVLPPDTVCTCLDDTGERKVRVYERCERCGVFMESEREAEGNYGKVGVVSDRMSVERLAEISKDLAVSHGPKSWPAERSIPVMHEMVVELQERFFEDKKEPQTTLKK